MTDQIITLIAPNHGAFPMVSLPRPDLIDSKPIAEAFTHFFEAKDRWSRLGREREIAERRLLDAQSEDAIRMAELYERGEGDDADPNEATLIAEAELKKAKARIEPAERAALSAYRAFREVIAGNKTQWQKSLRKRSEAARDQLSVALRKVELARAELEASLGVLEMLHGDALPDSLAAQWTFGSVETDSAIAALADAVVVVNGRVREL